MGIDRCRSSKIPHLEYAEADARAVAKTLGRHCKIRGWLRNDGAGPYDVSSGRLGGEIPLVEMRRRVSLVLVGLSLFWSWPQAVPVRAGIPRYPGTPTPLVSLLFPVVRRVYVELHYTPVLRVDPKGVFITTEDALRNLPAEPISLVVVDPLSVSQWDAKVIRRDPETGLVALTAPFPGPVYRLGGRLPRNGAAVVLAGSPPKVMKHMIAPDHSVPDLRPLHAGGRISGLQELIPCEGCPVSSAWAVLDPGDRTLLGILSSNGKRASFIPAAKIREFLRGAGFSVP